MNQMPFTEARKHVTHPIACIDCHEPTTMQLRVTRPGFIEGIRALKDSQGEKDYDVNQTATRQEMRTYVCAQCHVEYYFKGQEKQFYLDFIEAENSMGFHASQEAVKLLGQSIDFSRKGQMALRSKKEEVSSNK
jgi:formate-dependent nitrite reductase cytochrome c552 subunit